MKRRAHPYAPQVITCYRLTLVQRLRALFNRITNRSL